VIGGAESRFFAGSIDELRFYNTALNQTSIESSYNNGNGTFASNAEDGLFACYHFNEGSDRNAYDSKGISHTLLYQYKTDANPPDTDLAMVEAFDHFRELGFYGRDFNFPLSAPASLSANPFSTSAIDLSWVDTTTRETGFEIQRASNAAFTQNVTTVLQVGSNTVSFRDTGLTAGTTYFYRVVALDGPARSTPSNIASASTQASVVSDVIVNPTADTYVRGGTYSNANYGSAQTIFAKTDPVTAEGQHEIYMKFLLPASTGTLVSAKLRIYVSYGTATSTHRAFLVSNDAWNESTITFANKPFWGTQIASWSPFPSAAYIEIPLDLNSIKTELEGDRALSLRIANDTNGYHSYRSKEMTSLKPSLILTIAN
jgi:hypothetical protein